MADEARNEDQEDGKGGKGKLILFALLGLLILGGGGAGAAWFLGLFGGGAAAVESEPGTEGDDEGKQTEQTEEKSSIEKDDQDDKKSSPKKSEEVYFVELPDVLVNLRSNGKRMRYLKLRLALEVDDPDVASVVRALTPRVMDSIQLYLRALSVDDVRGAIGMEKLKEEMLARINRVIRPHRVEDVLFKEMLVQ